MGCQLPASYYDQYGAERSATPGTGPWGSQDPVCAESCPCKLNPGQEQHRSEGCKNTEGEATVSTLAIRKGNQESQICSHKSICWLGRREKSFLNRATAWEKNWMLLEGKGSVDGELNVAGVWQVRCGGGMWSYLGACSASMHSNLLETGKPPVVLYACCKFTQVAPGKTS